MNQLLQNNSNFKLIMILLCSLVVFISLINPVSSLGTLVTSAPNSCSGTWINCANAYTDDLSASSSPNADPPLPHVWTGMSVTLPTDAIILSVSLVTRADKSQMQPTLNFSMWDNTNSIYLTSVEIPIERNNPLYFTNDITSHKTWTISDLANMQVEYVKTGTPNNRYAYIYYIEVQLVYNQVPYTPSPVISSVTGTNRSDSDLNCSSTISDPNSDNLNVTVKWYENGTEKLSIDYNNSYASGTNFWAPLGVLNTTKYDTWNCSIQTTDGNMTSDINYSGSLYVLSSKPTAESVLVEDIYTSPLNEIDLFPGTTSQIKCDAVATDFDGENDIDTVDVDLFLTSSGIGSGLDPNDHYVNNTCTIDTTYGNIVEAAINCTFSVIFYANPGNWTCYVNVTDVDSWSGYGNDTTNILDLVAFDVSDGNIYFGMFEHGGDTGGNDYPKTITNLGNVPIDIAMNPFGTTLGDTYSMNCISQDLPDSNLKYSLTSLVDYSLKTSLTSNPGIGTQELGFNLAEATSGTVGTTKDIYFGMGVGAAGRGSCNGNIMFTALQSA